MQDIKIPDSHDKDPQRIKPDFEVTKVEPGEAAEAEASERVKVKFDNFVQLVATHNFEEVMQKHGKEDLILSTNLLTDLANAHEERSGENKKLPIFFIAGVIIGVVITYLVVRF